MAWGGGGFGPPMGGGGPNGRPGGGLPFAGIPSELQSGVDLLLEEEPDHGDPGVVFTQRRSTSDRERLGLGRLLVKYPGMLVLSAVLVVIVSVAAQAGPALTQIAINQGMSKGHRHLWVVAVVAGVYLATVAITALSQRASVQVTGRLAAWVMHDLRIKVFKQLQRLSLDYFTEEKAGVIMTRMTSDIENLQQLLQDGLAQFAIQALTMVVITAWLFATNVRLAAITVLLIVPILTVSSLWFRSSSERGYSRVRDGFANVLSDI